MEVIKRKLSLESLISREEGINYGIMTADTFNLNVFLTQTIEDMGMFTDTVYTEGPMLQPFTIGGAPNSNNVLVAKLLENGHTFNFMYSAQTIPIIPNVGSYYAFGSRVSAYTSSRLTELKKYDAVNPYEAMFYFDINTYTNYQGVSVDGVSTIFDLPSSGYTGYSFDTPTGATLGTVNQIHGLLMYDTDENIINHDDELNMNIRTRKATISYIAQGWNMTNTSLSANAKEEMYLGITSPPEVESEIFIERGDYNVLEPHLRLSEIESLEHLENYSNGSYYNIVKQSM